MVMRKIFFGSIVFFSLAFLAACGGGSGSSGATGATGATGAAGADGSSGSGGSGSVPTASATIYYDNNSAVDDTDYTLATFTPGQALNVALDNVTTAGSKLRYYIYWATGTSSGDISAQAKIDDTITSVQMSTFNGDGWPTSTNVIDPRYLTAGNYTISTPSWDLAGDEMHPATKYLQIYSGNEAGDATTPATLAISNAGVNYTLSGGTDGVACCAADNSTMGAVVPTGSANDFQMIHTNHGATGVIAQGLTDAKASAPVASGASAAHDATGDATVVTMAAMGTSDAVYVLVQDNLTSDNGTFYYRTAATGDLSSGTGALGDTFVLRKGALLLPVSDTKAYAVWARSKGGLSASGTNVPADNGTIILASLLTLSAGTVTVTDIGDTLPAKSGWSQPDNNTQLMNASRPAGGPDGMPADFPFCAAAHADARTNGGAVSGDTSVELAIGYADNGTLQAAAANYLVRFTSDSDNFSYRTTVTDTGLNTSLGVPVRSRTIVCGMTWADGLIDTTTATDNGTLWMAVNRSAAGTSDNMSLMSTTLADNGSTASFTFAGGIDYNNTINQIELTYDHRNRPYVATLLDNGSVMVAWKHGSNSEANIQAYNNVGGVTAAADSAKPISFARSADGKQLALSYHTVSGSGTDIKTVIIYADGATY